MIAFLKSVLLTITVAVSILVSSPLAQAASPGEFDKRVEMVRIGDTQSQVLQFLDREPDRTQRSNVMGVHKAVLEFDVGPFQYELVFYADHLVSKTSRSRKPTFLDRFSL